MENILSARQKYILLESYLVMTSSAATYSLLIFSFLVAFLVVVLWLSLGYKEVGADRLSDLE
jgi:dolichyl-phosphate-mannose--protein O-mannosyl transferase